MRIIDFFSSLDQEYWLNEITKCDWPDAQTLSKLITEDNFNKNFGEGKLYLLIDNEKLISFGTLSQRDCIEDAEMYPWIGCIFTIPIHRGNRYSQKVIDKMLADAMVSGYSCVYLSTQDVGLYEKYGFSYLENRIDINGADSRIYFKNLEDTYVKNLKNESIHNQNPSIDIAKYKERFPHSGELFKKAKEYLPAGVGSTARATWSGWQPYPLFAEKGDGCRLIDVDGNEFIDYMLGLGPMLLGHRPKVVTEAVARQIQKTGTVFALGNELEIIAAKKVCDSIPSIEKVRFVNSGTEAVSYALRLARAYTGRNKIVRFEGMYHGFSDSIYWNKHPSSNAVDQLGNCIPEPQGPGLPEGIKDSLLICQWNNLEALTKIIEENYMDIAAIITEPVMCNTGCILPRHGYLDEMRKISDKYGILLIFDEVITGYRIGLSGAQGYYGIIPDLTVLAKGLGGGYPVAALGGKKEIMELVDTGKVSIAGTYSGNGIALSAVSSTLDYLQTENLYEELNRTATKLRDELDMLWKKSKISAYVIGIGAMFQVWFSAHPITNYREAIQYANGDIFHIWWEEMLYQGVLFHPHYFENLFVSTSHKNRDIEVTLEKAEQAIATVEKRCGF